MLDQKAQNAQSVANETVTKTAEEREVHAIGKPVTEKQCEGRVGHHYANWVYGSNLGELEMQQDDRVDSRLQTEAIKKSDQLPVVEGMWPVADLWAFLVEVGLIGNQAQCEED